MPGSGQWRRVAVRGALALGVVCGLPAGAGAGAAPPAGPAAGTASAGDGLDARGVGAAASDDGPLTAPARVEREPSRRRWELPLPRGRVLAAQAEERWGRWALGGSGDPAHPASRPGFHPGTRVRVDARVVEGRLPARVGIDRRTGRRPRVLTAAALVAAARRQGYWPFRLCFEDAVREAPALAGRVRWTARIDARGRVTHVTLVGSAWKHTEGEACLGRELRRLRFAPPPAPVHAAIEVAVWPGDVPLPARPPPAGAPASAAATASGAAPTAPVLTGQVSVTAVDAALDALGGAPEGCLRAARAADPALWGRLALRLVLDQRGQLVRVRQEGTRFPATAAVACVTRALQRGVWPASEGGEGEVVVAWRLAAPDGDAEGLPPLRRPPASAVPAEPACAGPVGCAPAGLGSSSGIPVGPVVPPASASGSALPPARR